MEIKAQPIADIEHPVDGIGSAGIDEVKDMLVREGIINYDFEFDGVLEDIGSEWVAKKGKYAGTFPKRLAKSIKARFKKKIDPQTLGNLGELAKRHTVEAMGYKIDFTSDFSWRCGAFGDEGSCFWGDHAGALPMIADAGGLAVRFYDEEDKGYGRAWMLPYGKHWVIFNAYGKNLTTITVARILATEMGWSYKRVWFSNNGSYDDTLWINGGVAYLIGETGKIEEEERVDLEIEEVERRGEYTCYNCEDRMDDYYSIEDTHYCQSCYEENYFFCEQCETDRPSEDSREVYRWSGGNSRFYPRWICCDCANDATDCWKCGDTFLSGLDEVEGRPVCNTCIEELETCDDCGELVLTPHVTTEYPRLSNGTYTYKVVTTRCHGCHFQED